MSAPPQESQIETPQLIYDPEAVYCWHAWRFVMPYMSKTLLVGFLARNLRMKLRAACFILGRDGGLVRNLRVVAEERFPWCARTPESDAVWKSTSKPLEKEAKYRDFKQLQVHGSQQQQDATTAEAVRLSLETFEDIIVAVDKLLAEQGVKLTPDEKGRFKKEQDIEDILHARVEPRPFEGDFLETWGYLDEVKEFKRAREAGVAACQRENSQQQREFFKKITNRPSPPIPSQCAPPGLLAQVRAQGDVRGLIPCCAKFIGYYRDLRHAAQQFADTCPELYQSEDVHNSSDELFVSEDYEDDSCDDEPSDEEHDSNDSNSEGDSGKKPFRDACDAADAKTSMRLAPTLLDSNSNLREHLQRLSDCAVQVLAAVNAHGWYIQ